MAAQVMRVGSNSNGSFLDSPVFTGRRSNSPPSELVTDSLRSSIPALNLDTTSDNDLEQVPAFYTSPSFVATPDSGFSCVASSTRSKTPELESQPSTAGSGSGVSSSGRKRKTVTIDESQSSVVVITPDDLFDTYSKFESQSLESRDNPFLPGGELSKEAEDLLSRATIIRDTFYLNAEEKRELQQLQEKEQAEQEAAAQQKPHRTTKHVSILDHHDGQIYTSADHSSPPLPSHNGVVEDRISPQSASNALAAAPPSDSTADATNRKRENGKTNDTLPTSSPDNVKVAIPEGEGQSLPNTSFSPGPGDPLSPEAEKKRRNKCCTVM